MRHTVPFLALAGLALLLVPLASAVEFPFGTAVAGTDFDYSPIAESQKMALCFIDSNGDLTPDANDLVLLLFKVGTAGTCPATLTNQAILLNAVGNRPAGLGINQIDDLANKPLTSLTGAHAIRYVEDGSDTTKMDGKDIAYIDLHNLGGKRVDVGDLRVGPFGAAAGGLFVTGSDPDLGRALSDIKGTLRQAQDANVVYKAGSAYYINADMGVIGGSVDGTCATTACPVTGDFGVESGDVRLNPKAANPLTDVPVVLPEKVELLQTTVAPGQPFQLKVTMRNSGKVFGAGLVESRIDDVVLDSRGTPTVAPTEAATIIVTLLAPMTPGQHMVKVGTFGDFLTVSGTAAAGGAAPDLAALQAQVTALQAQVAALQPGGVKPASAAVGAPGLTPSLVVVALAALAIAVRRGK